MAIKIELKVKQAMLLTALALVGVNALAATPGATVAAFHAAIGAGDKERALALLSPAVVIYEAGHVERSRDEYASHHLGDDMAFGKTTTRTVLKHSERIDGTMAMVLDETETSGVYNDKPVHAFGVETSLLEKKGDAWLIVHVHWSSRKSK